MAAYEAVTRLLANIERPVIIGLDGNTWNQGIDLRPAAATDRTHPFFTEHAFYGGDPPHGLDDAFLRYLRGHPTEYARCLAERPGGPLAVSYVRGRRENRIEDRFDYLFVSPDVCVRSCRYDLATGLAAGSDHAIVRAEVEIEASEGF